MNTATIYDLTAKEYMHLGKIGDDWFGDLQGNEKLLTAFLCRVKYGHEIRIYLDSKGEPDGFYDGISDEESEESGVFTLWKEIDPETVSKLP